MYFLSFQFKQSGFKAFILSNIRLVLIFKMWLESNTISMFFRLNVGLVLFSNSGWNQLQSQKYVTKD